MAPQIDMPMNTANHHAAVAEEYQAQGLIVLAAEEHQKAADALLAAIERSTDESAKRTLRLLYNRHCKDRDDLQRKIQKLQDEGKDPSLPQRTEVAPMNRRLSSNAGASSAQNQTGSASQQLYHRPTMSDSNTVDESFMVLGGQGSDPGDAFNQFWNVLQGMLDNISQPVAFATAPLNTLDIPSDDVAQSSAQSPPSPPQHTYPSLRREHGAIRESDDDHLLSRWTKKIGLSRESSRSSIHDVRSKGKGTSSSFDEDEFDEFLEEGDDLSGSFFLIPEQSAATLRKENAGLKTQLLATQEKLKAAEHLLKLRKEQDMQLRNSIFEAQRAMSASGMLPRQPGGDANALSFAKVPQVVPAPPPKPNREAQYTKRIKELEDELRGVKAENEKNKLMIVKFRERWEKLKESAKRKKEAKTSGESVNTNVRNQKIVEEPEAEEELDGTNG